MFRKYAKDHPGVRGPPNHAALSTDAGLMAVILIVEDEIFIRQSAELTIGDLGHETLVAGDLAEALVHLNVAQPIDALFVDIRLDKIAQGGYAVANQILKFWPGLRVLYTSGTPLTDDMTDQFVRGGQFIQKPYSPDQLGNSVENLLY
jgi:DNA-binding NtrC family response regulator